MLADHIHHYKEALSKAKSDYYSNIIGASEGNSRFLFSVVKNFLGPSDTLPLNLCSTELCNSFKTFFLSLKIKKIHQQLLSSNLGKDSSCQVSQVTVHSNLTIILPTAAEILCYIWKSKTTTCQLDPLPTCSVKACLPSLSSLITKMIHSSFVSGSVSSSLKTAIITHILKKSGSDTYIFKNYRPISNIPFISKILEKCVAAQVHSHLSSNTLFEQFQSGFRPHHDY